jgi:multidrug transporter EmrE-like cation transporter
MKIAIIFFFAVLSEVTATTALKFSEGFTKLIPSVVVVVGYGPLGQRMPCGQALASC